MQSICYTILCTLYSSLFPFTHTVHVFFVEQESHLHSRQGMATIDFYCSEHTIPPSYTSRSKTTTTHHSKQSHSISNKLVADHRRLAVLLEQEQRFMPNAYHMHKAVNECERMQLLETVLQIEVRSSLSFSLSLSLSTHTHFLSLLLGFLTSCLYVFSALYYVFLLGHYCCWGKAQAAE